LSIAYIRFPLASVDTRPDDIPREPLLERLLARAEAAVHDGDWRDDAWRLLQAPSPVRRADPDAPLAGRRPAAGPVGLFAAQGATAQGYACVASPLHYVAGMTNVHLPVGGLLRLAGAEAHALAQDFARVFVDGGQRLLAGEDGTLCCLFDRVVDAVTRDPEGVIGRDIGGLLPQGRDGPRLRRLMSEIEMWLFEHPVNSARAARQELPITGLWLWEGGPTLGSLPELPAAVVGRDVMFSAWSNERLAADQGSVLVISDAAPGTPAWRDFEAEHLVRRVSELRSGRLSRLELSASERRYSLGAHWHWRFWRRPRPWKEFFA
jgi:hypothetical protein